MVGQTAGGALAGGILLGIWGKERAITYVPEIPPIHVIRLLLNPPLMQPHTKTAYLLLLLVSVVAAAGTTHPRPTPARSTSTRPLPPLSSSSWPLASVSTLAKQPCLAPGWALCWSAHHWGWCPLPPAESSLAMLGRR